MFFRIYILTIIVGLGLLCTDLWFAGALILIWFISIPIRGRSFYKQWKKNLEVESKSLSFGIKSIQTQKINFLIINKLFSRSVKFRSIFKKLSLLLDDIHIKYPNNSQDHSQIGGSDSLVNDIRYRNFLCNRWNQD